MDQKKIGAFIAKCRKEKNMTQMQLAEALDVTSQAISKWENGRGMPEVSLLQPLCNILDISLNELFTGEHISAEEYKVKAEKNISKLFQEKQIANCKPVRNVFSMCFNTAMVVAMIEIIIGMIGHLFNNKVLDIMLVNATIWLLLALISFAKLSYDKNKFKIMKCSGICVEGEINEIIPVSWIRIGSYHTCRVVCKYSYEGNIYKAVSSYYIVSPFLQKESLYGNVYFEKNNPNKYSVELLEIGA